MPDRQFIRLHLNLCRQNTFHSANIFLYFFFHQGDVTLRFHCASVQVQVLSGAPNQYNPNQIFLIGDGFGLFVFFEKFEDTHFRNGVVKRPESKPRGPRKPKLAKDKEANYENHQKL